MVGRYPDNLEGLEEAVDGKDVVQAEELERFKGLLKEGVINGDPERILHRYY